MTDRDDFLDEDAAQANRADIRRVTVVSIVAFGAIVVASALAVMTGLPGG